MRPPLTLRQAPAALGTSLGVMWLHRSQQSPLPSLVAAGNLARPFPFTLLNRAREVFPACHTPSCPCHGLPHFSFPTLQCDAWTHEAPPPREAAEAGPGQACIPNPAEPQWVKAGMERTVGTAYSFKGYHRFQNVLFATMRKRGTKFILNSRSIRHV